MATTEPTDTTIHFLKKDGTISNALCSIVKEIFVKYDMDKDGMLSKEELRHYFSTLNNERLEDPSLDLCMMIINGNTIGFTLDDFYKFYEFQSRFKPGETFSDLSKQYSQRTLLERLHVLEE
ncbi:hypothetical protein BCR32DRAFT_276555 [Anaeromyces robustus]|uniref:EF-hand domain-containing protein n=1 Tax=Anaeromyces robustus TaxID=1754192 RepID=A0A1Y1XHC5_9FUNG|nr:hypothetical protein BCR32DRAFT_276555 [Anaeromyces robustus]|eukprot:ORX85137.1 hypothetical protein BCR32DRAFT_276555 [Anaeromyces robustus]